MHRNLFTFLSTLSLALSIAVGAIWVRSYGNSDYLVRQDKLGEGQFVVGTGNGQILLLRDSNGFFGRPRNHARFRWSHHLSINLMECYYRQVRHKPTKHHWQCGRFFVTWGEMNPPDEGSIRQAVIFPTWMPFGATLPLPLSWLLTRLSKRRFRAGCCPTCGYDLRATPNRCPECGTVPSSVAT